MRIVGLGLLFLLALILLVTCVIPPFNEGIALAARITARMDKEGKIGPIENLGGGFELLEMMRFIPAQPDFDEGFLLMDDSAISIAFVMGDGELIGVNYDPLITEFDNGDEDLINYVAQAVGSGPYIFLANLQPNFSGPPYWWLSLMEFDHQLIPPGPPGVDLENRVDTDFPNDKDFIAGASVYAQPGLFTNQIRLLCRVGGFPDRFYEYQYDLLNTDPGILNPFEIRIGAFVVFPDTPTNVRYFHHPPQGAGGTSLAQYETGGGLKTLTWDDLNIGSPNEIDIPDRIGALLSTGQLYSQLEGEGVVYSLGGSPEYDIPMGDLEFAYETFDEDRGEFRMIFILPSYLDYGDGKGHYFEVYSLKTDDLEKLD